MSPTKSVILQKNPSWNSTRRLYFSSAQTEDAAVCVHCRWRTVRSRMRSTVNTMCSGNLLEHCTLMWWSLTSLKRNIQESEDNTLGSRSWCFQCSERQFPPLSVFNLPQQQWFVDFYDYSGVHVTHVPGHLSSPVSLAVGGSLRSSCTGPAHDHKPEGPSASAAAVPLSGQRSGCVLAPHSALCHIRLYCQRQLSLSRTRWPLSTSHRPPVKPGQDE